MRRRWLKRLLIVVLVMAVLPLSLIGGAWLYVTSDAGGERARSLIVSKLTEQLQGKLAIESLSLRGGSIEAHGLKLYTPEGELVAEVDSLNADIALSQLVSGTITISTAKLDGVRLWLVSDDRGLNLTRALAAKVPSPDDGKPASFTVKVDALELGRGAVDFRAGEQHFAATALALAANAAASSPPLSLAGALTLRGELTHPVKGPLKLSADATTPAPGDVQLNAALSAAGARLDATLGLAELNATIKTLELPPEVLRAFAPSSPVIAAVSGTGTLSRKSADLKLSAANARATLQARYDLDANRVDELKARIDDADLSQLLEGGRPSRINLEVNGRLLDSRPSSLDGALEVTGRWRSPSGTSLAAIDGAITAAAGKLAVKKLQANAPGARLAVSGGGTTQSLSASGDVFVDDLHQLSVTLSELTGAPELPLAGSGALTLSAKGSLAHLALQAQGQLKTLSVGELALAGLTIDASMADVGRPLELSADVAAQKVRLADRTFSDVHFLASTQGRKLAVQLNTSREQGLRFDAAGVIDRDGRGLDLEVFSTRYPGVEWALAEAPVRIELPEGGIVIAPLTLRSGPQALTVAIDKRGNRVDAKLDAVAIDVSKLAVALAPPQWQLRGRLDAAVTAKGRLPRPEVVAAVTLADGHFRQLENVGLKIDAQYRDDLLTATAAADTAVGHVDGRFEGRLQAIAQERPEPLTGELTVRNVDVAKLATALEQPLNVMGTVSGQLRLSGTGAAPSAEAHIELTDGVLVLPATDSAADQYVPVRRLSLTLKPAENGRLVASLDGRAFGGKLIAELKTPFTLVGLRHDSPDLETIKTTPLELTAAVERLDLAGLEGARLSPVPMSGKIGLNATVTGTVRHPDALLKFTLEQVTASRLKPVDGSVVVNAGRDDTRLNVTVTRRGVAATVLSIEASVGLPLESFTDESRAAAAGLVVEGGIGPFALGDVWTPEGKDPPGGTVKMQLSASGSAADPKLRMRGTLEQVTLGKTPLGRANLAYDYADRQSVFSAALASIGGGTLRARGSVAFDVSLPALKRGLPWQRAPVEIVVEGKDFDLAFLSNAVSPLRTVGGQLTVNASVTGTPAVPVINGSAQWANGRLGIAGYGEYRDIALTVSGDNQHISLSELKLRSGGGSAAFTANATRTSTGYSLGAQGSTEKFPVISDDQLRAIVSLRTELRGVLSPELIEISPLMLRDVHVELPEVKNKDLQDIRRPNDIVLVRGANVAQTALRRTGPKKTLQAPEGRVIRLIIDAPQDVWVKSTDVNIEVGLSDGFRVEVADDVSLYGEVRVERGRIDVIGRRFDVQGRESAQGTSSYVRFQRDVLEPYLNLIATHINQAEGVTVFATLVGKGSDVSLKLTSNPPMSESEIFTLLATGRRSLKRGGSASITAGQAASVVGSFAAAQLKSVLAKKLPLDVVSIESGDDIRNTKVETGKYLTDKLYVGVQVQGGADRSKGESTGTGRIEYRFTPQWNLEAYGGDASFGTDFVWNRDF